jgi:predicted RNA-binding protein with RPS1 domain
MKKTAITYGTWYGRLNNLERRIRECGSDFPTEEEIDNLIESVGDAFGKVDTQRVVLLQLFGLKRKWVRANRELQKQRREEMATMDVQPTINTEEKLNLTEDIAASVFDAITKVAQANNIVTADTVTVTLNKDGGLIAFRGASSDFTEIPTDVSVTEVPEKVKVVVVGPDDPSGELSVWVEEANLGEDDHPERLSIGEDEFINLLDEQQLTDFENGVDEFELDASKVEGYRQRRTEKKQTGAEPKSPYNDSALKDLGIVE